MKKDPVEANLYDRSGLGGKSSYVGKVMCLTLAISYYLSGLLVAVIDWLSSLKKWKVETGLAMQCSGSCK